MTTQPAWTEQLAKPRGGQDHLGVGSVVTDQILPSLAPGINVLTPHPRYWAFYSMVVDQFWKESPKAVTGRKLLEYMTRKEAIFSAAGHICPHPEHRPSQDPIGSQRMRPEVRKNEPTFSSNFPFVKSLGGGYRLYYGTVMQTMGVIQGADRELNLPIDAVTPDRGKDLADAYRDAIASTKYWKKYWNADEVPRDVVEEYAAVACLCQLKTNAPDRTLIADTFLHGHAGPAHVGEPEARRTTLRMMLEIAHQTRNTPIAQPDFRRLLLYGSTYSAETGRTIARITMPDELVSVRRRWRLSQLREMFNYSLNGMWALITNWGLSEGGDYTPLPTHRVLDLADQATFSAVPGLGSLTAKSLLHTLAERLQAASQCTDSLDGAWSLDAEVTEDYLYDILREDAVAERQRLGVLFALYVLCLARIWDPHLPQQVGPIDWKPADEGGYRRIGMSLALRQLRHDAQTGTTIATSLKRVLEHHVINQHERVAIGKLNTGDTFRFRREANNLRFFPQKADFTLNDTRFDALSTACAELNWSGFFVDKGHGLTPEGEQIRATGDLIHMGAAP